MNAQDEKKVSSHDIKVSNHLLLALKGVVRLNESKRKQNNAL